MCIKIYDFTGLEERQKHFIETHNIRYYDEEEPTYKARTMAERKIIYKHLYYETNIFSLCGAI